ncbi:10485_t:CDS:2 [Paraglomus brasilianum]|uniref:10485_t:CDS:1 n=1 Tax=Paraglomus brasilianum TaxID=144538 RepID=A0A9N9B4P5_9GLOM|nr:10485_t:CDS:2 [Paraglomus brasilianum]
MIKKLSGQYSDIFSEVKEQYPSIISDKLYSSLKEETKSVEDFVKAEENYQKSPSDNGNDNSGNGTNNNGNSNSNDNSNGSNGGGNMPFSSNNSELEEKIKDLQSQLSTVKKELKKKQQQNPNSIDSQQEERKKDELERELERLKREKEGNRQKPGNQNPQNKKDSFPYGLVIEAKESKVSSFKIKHMTKNQKGKSFKEYLQEIEDPKNNSEVNYALPENPTPLQVAKFEICQEILGYKLDNDLTREQVAERIGISKAETEDILFCHIEEFTLDRLVEYASKLLDPIQYFSKEDNEWQWTYELKIIFNKNHIIAITITEHYQKQPGREGITNELILELLEELNG